MVGPFLKMIYLNKKNPIQMGPIIKVLVNTKFAGESFRLIAIESNMKVGTQVLVDHFRHISLQGIF